MNAPKPQGKSNLLHQQILGGLLANKTTVRTEVRGKKQNGKWVESTVPVQVPTLAGNVSNDNVDRAAKRWAA